MCISSGGLRPAAGCPARPAARPSRAVLSLALCGGLALAGACKKEGVDPDRGGDLASLAGLFDAARAEGEKAWPGATLGGVRVSAEIPPGGRANVYSLRVTFQFERDPSDPQAKSGSVLCSPDCRLIRHRVRGPSYPWPRCVLDAAYQAARAAGLTATRPTVTYGSWNGGAHWTFLESPGAEAGIDLDGETCAVLPP